MSKATATSHQVIPGYLDAYEQDVDGWTVSVEKHLTDMDQAPFFKGAPDDRCQAHHLGVVLEGKFAVRTADDVEEVFEAGDAFVIKPGHTPIVFSGCEYVAFTPADEAKQQAAVVMPNVKKYAAEHGIDLTPSTSS